MLAKKYTEYRKLKETELAVSAIAFGAWAAGGCMWGGNDDQKAIDEYN